MILIPGKLYRTTKELTLIFRWDREPAEGGFWLEDNTILLFVEYREPGRLYLHEHVFLDPSGKKIITGSSYPDKFDEDFLRPQPSGITKTS